MFMSSAGRSACALLWHKEQEVVVLREQAISALEAEVRNAARLTGYGST